MLIGEALHPGRFSVGHVGWFEFACGRSFSLDAHIYLCLRFCDIFLFAFAQSHALIKSMAIVLRLIGNRKPINCVTWCAFFLPRLLNNDWMLFQIITSGGVTYKNEPWHRECFTCTHCSTSLAGQRFTSRDDKPYCAECFGELFAKRCTACIKPITGKSNEIYAPARITMQIGRVFNSLLRLIEY